MHCIKLPNHIIILLYKIKYFDNKIKNNKIEIKKDKTKNKYYY